MRRLSADIGRDTVLGSPGLCHPDGITQPSYQGWNAAFQRSSRPTTRIPSTTAIATSTRRLAPLGGLEPVDRGLEAARRIVVEHAMHQARQLRQRARPERRLVAHRFREARAIRPARPSSARGSAAPCAASRDPGRAGARAPPPAAASSAAARAAAGSACGSAARPRRAAPAACRSRSPSAACRRSARTPSGSRPRIRPRAFPAAPIRLRRGPRPRGGSRDGRSAMKLSAR